MEYKIDKDMSLYTLINEQWTRVDLKPCFPVSNSDKFFSVRDKDGKEIKLIKSLEDINELSRNTIKEYLRFKTFKFEITGIHLIEEDFGVRHFEVETKEGSRNFQTELDKWPNRLSDGSILIEDIYGDQYRVLNLDFGIKLLSDYIN